MTMRNWAMQFGANSLSSHDDDAAGWIVASSQAT